MIPLFLRLKTSLQSMTLCIFCCLVFNVSQGAYANDVSACAAHIKTVIEANRQRNEKIHIDIEQGDIELRVQVGGEEYQKKLSPSDGSCRARELAFRHWLVRTRRQLHTTGEMKIATKKEITIKQKKMPQKRGGCPLGRTGESCLNSSLSFYRLKVGGGGTLGFDTPTYMISGEWGVFPQGHKRVHIGMATGLQFQLNPQIQLGGDEIRRWMATAHLAILLNFSMFKAYDTIISLSPRAGLAQTAGLNLAVSQTSQGFLFQVDAEMMWRISHRIGIGILFGLPVPPEEIIANQVTYGPEQGHLIGFVSLIF